MPLIVRQLTDVEVVELQTIENDKRKDLSPIEEAEKYQQLIDQYEKAGAERRRKRSRSCARS
jgi:ParB family chromosome partitioning protein